jgi:hypothetical protein
MRRHRPALALTWLLLAPFGCDGGPTRTADLTPRADLAPGGSDLTGDLPAADLPHRDGTPTPDDAGAGWSRNLKGSHTKRVTSPCTLYVKPGGSDSADGSSLAKALKTPSRAVSVAKPGDVVCFDQGTYPTLTIKNVKATASLPLVDHRSVSFGLPPPSLLRAGPANAY